MKMKLKWTDRILSVCSKDLVVHFFYNDPTECGNYWVTDGNVVLMGFYNTLLKEWFLYTYASAKAFSDLEEVRGFGIVAYSKVTEPKIPKKYRNDTK